MAKIQIFARLRPTNHRYAGLKTSETQFSVEVGKAQDEGQVDRFSRPHESRYRFKFSRVFEEGATQSEVFETVARHTVDRLIEGYNGTVFAYGQTSTGKTYTIEGSARQYEERGLVPRTLSYLYGLLEKKKRRAEESSSGGGEGEVVTGESGTGGGGGEEVKVHISYMEIYQDTGYDLLNPGTRPGSLMLTLPKVHISEGAGGSVIVRDLSSHEAATEEVALSLLFQGSTCRKVAETAMNQSSSRSHSIFTIMLTTKQPGSEVILRSKLHLVDLAGSERVAKTGLDGRILQEAKHINLSLHHLEHVIVSLQHQARLLSPSTSSPLLSPHTHRDVPSRPIHSSPTIKHSPSSLSPSKSRRWKANEEGPLVKSPISRGHGSTSRSSSSRYSGGHIPYRNSMLTMVLKDSLGGNCLTAMIATVSAEESNIWETISTLRFSQRVACISNKVKRNEELDDKAVIKKLKRRVGELERELAALREQGPALPPQSTDGVSGSGLVLSEAERKLCHRVLYDFFHGKIHNPVEAGINTLAMFQESLLVLRSVVLHALRQSSHTSHTSTTPSGSSEGDILPSTAAANASSHLSNSSVHPSERRKKGSSRKRSKKRREQTARLEPEEAKADVLRIDREGTGLGLPGQVWPGPTPHAHSKEQRGLGVDEGATPPSLPHHQLLQTHATLTATATPSPTSRLSSGFGSLLDEEAAAQLRPVGSSCSREYSVSHGGPAVGTGGDDIGGGGGGGDGGRSREGREGGGGGGGGGRRKEKRQGGGGEVRGGGENSQPWAVKVQRCYPSQSPEHPSQPTPPAIHTPPIVSSSEETPAHNLQGKPPPYGSSPQERAMWQLETETVRLAQSREQREQLSGDVQVLSLKVEEEELRAQLSTVAEQLASQHARVLQSHQVSGAGTSSGQLCAEKIAEQQLRIKQARLHQRFLGVLQQIKALQTSPTKEGKTLPISPPTKSPLSPRASIAQVINEVARTEVKQSKVQQEIERLRISQAEKQLELKEAATRRKLWELKQQLLQSSTSHSMPPPATSTATATAAATTATSTAIDTATAAKLSSSQPPAQSTLRATLPQSHSPVQSYLHSTQTSLPHSQSSIQSYDNSVKHAPNKQRDANKPPYTAPQQLAHTHESASHMPSKGGVWLGVSVDGRNPARVNQCAEEENLAHRSSQMKGTKTRFFLQPTHTQEGGKDAIRGVNESVTKNTEAQVDISRTSEAKPSLLHSVTHTDSRTASHKEDVLQQGHAKSHPFKITPTTSQYSPQKGTSSTDQKTILKTDLHSSHRKDSLSPSPAEKKPQSQKRQRLTLPDEIKETEYMSAVQRQRARVSRIRRCIAAATVIQRAWREHKEKEECASFT